MVQMVKDLNGPDGIVTLTYTTLFEYRSDLYAPFISYIQRTTFKANFPYTTFIAPLAFRIQRIVAGV